LMRFTLEDRFFDVSHFRRAYAAPYTFVGNGY
jgi:hypothetical protein